MFHVYHWEIDAGRAISPNAGQMLFPKVLKWNSAGYLGRAKVLQSSQEDFALSSVLHTRESEV